MVIEEKLVTKQDLNESENRLSNIIVDQDKRLSDLDKRVMLIEEKMATKQDLVKLDKRLSGAIFDLDRKLSDRMTSLEHQMKSLQLTLSLRMGGMIAAGVIILGAIIKL